MHVGWGRSSVHVGWGRSCMYGAGEGCGGVVWDSVVWHGVVLICGVWLSFNPSKPLSLSGRFVASALLNMFFLVDSILASMVLARFL